MKYIISVTLFACAWAVDTNNIDVNEHYKIVKQQSNALIHNINILINKIDRESHNKSAEFRAIWSQELLNIHRSNDALAAFLSLANLNANGLEQRFFIAALEFIRSACRLLHFQVTSDDDTQTIVDYLQEAHDLTSRIFRKLHIRIAEAAHSGTGGASSSNS